MNEQTTELIERLLKAINGCWTFNEYGGVCNECRETLAWLVATFPDVESVQKHGYVAEDSRSRIAVSDIVPGTYIRIPHIGPVTAPEN